MCEVLCRRRKAFWRDILEESSNILGSRVGHIVMCQEESVQARSEFELETVERILSSRRATEKVPR